MLVTLYLKVVTNIKLMFSDRLIQNIALIHGPYNMGKLGRWQGKRYTIINVDRCPGVAVLR